MTEDSAPSALWVDACVIARIASSEEDDNNGLSFTPGNTSDQLPSFLFKYAKQVNIVVCMVTGNLFTRQRRTP